MQAAAVPLVVQPRCTSLLPAIRAGKSVSQLLKYCAHTPTFSVLDTLDTSLCLGESPAHFSECTGVLDCRCCGLIIIVSAPPVSCLVIRDGPTLTKSQNRHYLRSSTTTTIAYAINRLHHDTIQLCIYTLVAGRAPLRSLPPSSTSPGSHWMGRRDLLVFHMTASSPPHARPSDASCTCPHRASAANLTSPL